MSLVWKETFSHSKPGSMHSIERQACLNPRKRPTPTRSTTAHASHCPIHEFALRAAFLPSDLRSIPPDPERTFSIYRDVSRLIGDLVRLTFRDVSRTIDSRDALWQHQRALFLVELVEEVNASDSLQPLEFGTQRLYQFAQRACIELVLGHEGTPLCRLEIG